MSHFKQFETLKSQFKSETGLDASTHIREYIEYLKAVNLSQITAALAEIHNRLSDISQSVQSFRNR